jgi:UDP-N-acetyl-D-galactosamine dehydrogenase
MLPMVEYRIAIIGLGYVGLPLAVAFAEKYAVVGFDSNSKRVNELRSGVDQTGSVAGKDIHLLGKAYFESGNRGLLISDISNDISDCNIFIITVPTPLGPEKKPDLSFLLAASQTVGNFLKQGDIVIYESTVYPGCTEEDCIPVLEKSSGLKFNTDFFCGYSPERINPGDRIHTLKTVVKVTSGSTPEVADVINDLYGTIITAGTYKAPSIKVAEASKAIENAQRDVNISFMNEIALIFDRMGIDTGDVLDAASTKWNFLNFHPGLVGGHCIGVDPHYLLYKAERLGYQAQVILSGRSVNERMGVFVAEKVVKLLSERFNEKPIAGARVLILGFAFKENCPDTRNTKVIDIFNTLVNSGLDVSVYDPYVDRDQVLQEYKIDLVEAPIANPDVIVLAVAHDIFKEIDFGDLKRKGAVIFDTKNVVDRKLADGRL